MDSALLVGGALGAGLDQLVERIRLDQSAAPDLDGVEYALVDQLIQFGASHAADAHRIRDRVGDRVEVLVGRGHCLVLPLSLVGRLSVHTERDGQRRTSLKIRGRLVAIRTPVRKVDRAHLIIHIDDWTKSLIARLENRSCHMLCARFVRVEDAKDRRPAKTEFFLSIADSIFDEATIALP